MAITALPINNFVANGSLADPTGVAISSGAANRGQVPSVPTPPAKVNAKPELLLLRVANASGGAANVIVKAGAYPPALASGQGDLTVSAPNSATTWLGPFESGRFLQADGSVLVETAATMTITAFGFPRNT